MFTITFEWDESMGFPGAIIIKNHHHSQLYLKTVTLEDIPGHGRVHFICNSWVYPTHRYKYDRAFFSNKVIGFWITIVNTRMCAPTLCFIGPYSLCLPSRRRECVLLSSWTVDLMLASTIENLDILFPCRRNHKSMFFFLLERHFPWLSFSLFEFKFSFDHDCFHKGIKMVSFFVVFTINPIPTSCSFMICVRPTSSARFF